MAEEFVLRPASFRDIENVFLLSNDTEVRKNSIHEKKNILGRTRVMVQ